MENLKEILEKLKDIKDNVDFSSNRNQARKVYKILKEQEIEVVVQNVLEDGIFEIERNLLTEEDRTVAWQSFIISLDKIINTIDYNINA